MSTEEPDNAAEASASAQKQPSGGKPKGRARARRLARRRALQAMYQQELSGDSGTEVERKFREDQDLHGVDMDYFLELFHESLNQRKDLEAIISPHLDRAIESVDIIERIVLLISAYELKTRPEIPFRVVLNEGVELAKDFAGENSHSYINGVLDKLVSAFRPIEAQAARKRR
ncbi:MAG: transcription antitermination factor NusB [Gammaproteobacteria bacterium]